MVVMSGLHGDIAFLNDRFHGGNAKFAAVPYYSFSLRYFSVLMGWHRKHRQKNRQQRSIKADDSLCMQ